MTFGEMVYDHRARPINADEFGRDDHIHEIEQISASGDDVFSAAVRMLCRRSGGTDQHRLIETRTPSAISEEPFESRHPGE